MQDFENLSIDGDIPVTPQTERMPPKDSPGEIQGFLDEFLRMSQEGSLEVGFGGFQTFWESILQMTRAAVRREPTPERRWRLRSRPMRMPSDEEMRVRIQLLAARSRALAASIYPANGDDPDDHPNREQLVQIAVSFASALSDHPDLLLRADSADVQNLERMAHNFIHNKRKEP